MKKVTSSRKFKIYAFIGTVVIILSMMLYFGNKDISYKKLAIDAGLGNCDWAFANYGQIINNSVGKAGIDINIVSAWDITKGNQNVIVAVIDTGVDYECEILKDNLLFNESDPVDGKDNDENGYIDDYIGWNFYNNDGSIYEKAIHDYHGTYISTTIARVAPGIKLLPVKFMKSSKGTVEAAVQAIKYAIDRGARIINCSWNYNSYNDELYRVMKDNSDILFVCAAGNSNINLDDELLYPCSFELDNIITVMSVDNLSNKYEASGYGKNVDIAAPGVDVNVIFPENKETTIDGTSVSAAFVSATAALLLSEDETKMPSEIKSIILESAHQTQELKDLCKSGGYLDVKTSLLKIYGKN